MSTTKWNPESYLTFADQRGRPFHDLVARIGAAEPRRVVDLGCGPGNLTATLPKQWPNAAIEAIDSSPEMVEAACAAGVDARLGNLMAWQPDVDVDVVISNAVLQWIPGHRELLRSWLNNLRSGAWLAFQVPGNFDAPSHREIHSLAGSVTWRDRLNGLALRGPGNVQSALDYAAELASLGAEIDAWETTYLHRLVGEDPVLEWVSSTALRPVRSVLTQAGWTEFRAELGDRLRAAYPRQPDGITWYPFRRIFVVARKTC
ncbi:trans-aconitate 2-methyltransferase [Actinoalloteichus hymeniacidonis]|uniref:Trans-aconitate methyltransferase n=1 Tax=Actinoalloteichus hymeniacidonis TaxID=340345 RepID=A0AAC9HSW8_9PSEU|nr:trans-aconitate 2-methyltransferase [Actinoalloteichus hymeniacidonis]AOS65032.1 trans-aconitate methyltransferase [Actinoalloteichus hymeniacidonis]MBB5906889.1 trans-aconitate 2-methyltransferase [Actinoalloteichus hymeniacidonis]